MNSNKVKVNTAMNADAVLIYLSIAVEYYAK